MRGVIIEGNRRKVPVLLIIIVLIISLIPLPGMAAQQTITIDGDMSDWTVDASTFSDSLGDVNGAGPHDLIKMYITNDANYLYVRWDAIAALADLKSVTYGLALTSIPATGDTRPAKEVLLYIDYDSKSLATVTVANSTTETVLDVEATSNTSSFVRAAEFGVTNKTVSIEARFPLTAIDALTVNTVDQDASIPLWGATLSSGAFTSVVKDYIPDLGFFQYDMVSATYTPVGTGAIPKVSGSTLTPKAQPGATVYYTVTISNVGTSDLSFSQVNWTLPAGFTYNAGSTTGVTTTDPVAAGTPTTLTWSGLTGSVPPGDSVTLNFSATAAPSAGTYYSQATLTAASGNVQTGDTAMVELAASYTPPGTPQNLTASDVTENSARLTWETVADATSYQIYQHGVLVATVTAPDVTTVITGLSPSTSYEFTVVAVNASGISSAPSNTENVTTLTPPDTTAPTQPADPNLATSGATASSIQVDWDKATDDRSAQGALQYLVYYSTSNNLGSVADIEANGTAFSTYQTNISTMNVTGLSEDTQYYFNVIVMDEAGNKTAYTTASDSTLPLPDTTPPTQPTNADLTASNATTTSIQVDWDKATDDRSAQGALQYLVYYSTSNNLGSVADIETNGTAFSTYQTNISTTNVTGLSEDTLYYFNVIVIDEAGNKTAYNTAAESTLLSADTTPPTQPADPNLATSGATTSSIQVDWDKATDDRSAQGDLQYLVYYSTSNNLGSVADIETNGTAFSTYQTNISTMNVTGLSEDTQYYFNVIVMDEAGNKTAYTTASDSTAAMAAPTLSSSSTTDTETTLNWTTVPGATSYTVYLDDGAGGTIVSTVAAPATTLNVTGLTQGTDYTYYVVATDGTNTSESNHVTVSTTDTQGPNTGTSAVSAASPTNTTLDISWPKATDNVSAQGALTYRAYHSASNNISTLADITANGTLVGSGTDIDTLTATGLSPNSTYYFNVVVTDEAGNESVYLSGAGTTATPTAVTASPQNVSPNSATLGWNDVTGATQYDIYDGSGNLVGSVSAPNLSYNLTGLSPNTTYSYTVAAMSGTTQISVSNLASFTTLGNPAVVPNPQTGYPIDIFESIIDWLAKTF